MLSLEELKPRSRHLPQLHQPPRPVPCYVRPPHWPCHHCLQQAHACPRRLATLSATLQARIRPGVNMPPWMWLTTTAAEHHSRTDFNPSVRPFPHDGGASFLDPRWLRLWQLVPHCGERCIPISPAHVHQQCACVHAMAVTVWPLATRTCTTCHEPPEDPRASTAFPQGGFSLPARVHGFDRGT